MAPYKMATVDVLTAYNEEKNGRANCGTELDGYSLWQEKRKHNIG